MDSESGDGLADAARLGYLGMSMGTRFGLPFAAAMGDEIDLLGSPEKELAGYPGQHAETKPAANTLWREFVARRLAPCS